MHSEELVRPPGANRTPVHAHYLYAVVPANEPWECPVRGIDDRPVHRIVANGLAVVVSSVTRRRMRPERRHLAASQAVQMALLRAGDMLPIAFGTVAADRDAIARLLERRHEEFATQLRRVAGKVEMGLRLRLDAPDVVRHIAAAHPPLAAMCERHFGSSRRPSYEELIEIGRDVEAAVNNYRTVRAQRLTELMSPCCAEIVTLPVRGERELANMACLVPKSGQDLFESGIAAAASQFGDEFMIDYSGPWAPYNFTTTHVDG